MIFGEWVGLRVKGVHAPLLVWYRLKGYMVLKKETNLSIFCFFTLQWNAFFNIIIFYYLLMRQDVWFEDQSCFRKLEWGEVGFNPLVTSVISFTVACFKIQTEYNFAVCLRTQLFFQNFLCKEVFNSICLGHALIDFHPVSEKSDISSVPVMSIRRRFNVKLHILYEIANIPNT